ncbi:resuscitation promoting factor [Burkholderia pseudomallei]|nr:resuscitation promoting factor [Burkholderia pseudomallei]ARK55345.1 resuscitation promoting factor [Burkholderia pseudomallei]ARK65165.1 resuscitation promoting factor [Burkholderia pseudomallei]ARK69174.1 resuscitation promoting factor [Burkholderia pseudomallei]ARK82865.1 resuscitation promoting factor [Burkholderia pseudomallei]
MAGGQQRMRAPRASLARPATAVRARLAASPLPRDRLPASMRDLRGRFPAVQAAGFELPDCRVAGSARPRTWLAHRRRHGIGGLRPASRACRSTGASRLTASPRPPRA